MGYAKVERRIWNDRKFMELTDDGRMVFLFLMTHPHMTSVGAMRATMPGLAEELRWPLERFRDGFETLSERYMAAFDEAAGMVALPNYLKHNAPANPNVVKGWLSALELLPECDLKRDVINRCINRIETVQAWVSEGLAKPFRNMEQEQYQEQEQKQTPDKNPPEKLRTEEASSVGTKRRTKLELDSLPEAWRPVGMTLLPPGADVDAEFGKFRDHHQGKGTLAADWPATWRTWCRRAADFGPRAPRSSQAAVADGNDTRTRGWTPPVDDAGTPP